LDKGDLKGSLGRPSQTGHDNPLKASPSPFGKGDFQKTGYSRTKFRFYICPPFPRESKL
jgi:hypothetical protein